MNGDKRKRLRTRLLRRKAWIGVAIAVVFGALAAFLSDRYRSTGELTDHDVADIAAVIHERTPTPIAAITPKRGGTVQVFVRQKGELGRQLFNVRKSAGEWEITHHTLFY